MHRDVFRVVWDRTIDKDIGIPRENLLMDFMLNPDFVKELFERIADYNITQLEKAVTYDIDAVYFGDDWGQQSGLIMGYEFWKEFIYTQ